jgi:putative peptidoglycan lipid II flippase
VKTQWKRWLHWKQASVNRRIFSATVLLMGLMLLGRGMGFLRDILVARTFGVGGAVDAYITSVSLLVFANSLVVIPLGTAFIPHFIRTREEQGREAAERVIGNMMALALIVFGALYLLLWVGGDAVLRFMVRGLDGERIRVARTLFDVMLPGAFLSALGNTLAVVLNCGEKFKLTGLAPLIQPTVTTLVLTGMLSSGVTANMDWIAAATSVGGVGEGLFLLAGLKLSGHTLPPVWAGTRRLFSAIVHQSGALGLGTLLMSVIGIIELMFAGRLGDGAISTLNYGGKINAAIGGVGSAALGTVALPYFSRMVATRDLAGLQQTLKRYSVLVLVVTVPLVAVLILLSGGIVKLAYQRGAFSPEDTVRVCQVQQIYLLQIPVYILGALWGKLISAMHHNQILMWGAALNLLVCVVANLLLDPVLGVAGVALSNTLVYAVSTVYLWAVLRRAVPQVRDRDLATAVSS